MKIGLVKANFPGERRVPLLPKDIKDFKNEILVEEGLENFLILMIKNTLTKDVTFYQELKFLRNQKQSSH
jgi:alanine dehydrogenase